MRHCLLLALACAALIAGCGKSDDTSAAPTSTSTTGSQATTTTTGSAYSLAGVWENSEAAGDGATTTFTFKDDGTYLMDLEGPIPGQAGMTAASHVTGHYKVDGDKITLHTDTIEMSSKDEKLNAEFAKQNEKMKDEVAKAPDATGKVEFTDKDHAVITTDAEPKLNVPAATFKLKRKA